MARTTTRKKTKRKPRKKAARRFSRINFKSIIYKLFLISILIFSIGVLTYVIFFRVVVAAEIVPNSEYEATKVERKGLKSNRLKDSATTEVEVRPLVAIIIDDMGYNRDVGESLIRLPVNLSFSFLPHAPFTSQLEDMAFKYGKTIMLHLPLEPKDKSWDPGPGALLLNDMENQNELFNQNLSMVPHATGVNNHMGSLYTESEKGMTALLKLIAEKKLFFIDSLTSSSSQGFTLAQKIGVQSARRNIFLDNSQKSSAICVQLEKLAEIAMEKGRVIGIAHPHQETLVAIQSCIHTIEQSVQLVGVEKLVK